MKRLVGSRRLLAAAVTLGLIHATVFVSVAPAGATHSWASYHWARKSNPFTLKLGDNLTTTAWKGHLGTVSADWSASAVLDTPVVAGKAGRNCKAVTGTVQACNRAYGFNGWLGLAQVWVSGSHITKATAKVNDSYFSTSTYNNPNAKRHVLCQEVGHTLGLGHQTAVSCMDDVNGLFDPAYVSPNAHDYEQLELIYAHLDSTTTVASAAAGAAAFNGNDDAGDGPDFGAPIAKGRGGKDVLFVRDLGGGKKVFTWVFWAEPGAAGLK